MLSSFYWQLLYYKFYSLNLLTAFLVKNIHKITLLILGKTYSRECPGNQEWNIETGKCEFKKSDNNNTKEKTMEIMIPQTITKTIFNIKNEIDNYKTPKIEKIGLNFTHYD